MCLATHQPHCRVDISGGISELDPDYHGAHGKSDSVIGLECFCTRYRSAMGRSHNAQKRRKPGLCLPNYLGPELSVYQTGFCDSELDSDRRSGFAGCAFNNRIGRLQTRK